MAGVFDHRLRPVPSPVYDRPNPRRGSSHDVPGGARQRNIPHDEPRHPPNTGAGSAPWPNFEHRTDGQRADAAGSDPDRRRRRMGRRPVGRRGYGGRLRCRHAGGARRQTTDLEPVDPEDLQALRTPYESYIRHRRLDRPTGRTAPPRAQHINGVRAVVEATLADHLLHAAVLVEAQARLVDVAGEEGDSPKARSSPRRWG